MRQVLLKWSLSAESFYQFDRLSNVETISVPISQARKPNLTPAQAVWRGSLPPKLLSRSVSHNISKKGQSSVNLPMAGLDGRSE